MPTLLLTVHGKPLGKAAAATNMSTGATYNVKGTVAWMGRAIHEVTRQLPADWRPLDEPCEAYVTAIFGRPKTGANAFKKRSRANDARTRYGQKPDADNISKIALDALTHAGVWRDDCLPDVTIKRRWQALNEAPRVEILLVWGADMDRLPWPPDALEDW